jgi:hypothetical protein
MEIPDIPFDALSYTLVAVTFALPMAFPVSLALLWVYLRAVKRSMLRRAAGETPTVPAPSAHDASGQTIGPPEKPLQIAMIDATAIPVQWTATRRVWLTGIIHAIAGVAFAYVMGTVFLLANGLGFDWQVALGSAMLYAWPIVIVLGLVCAVSWLGLGLLVLGYALVLAATMAVLAAGTTITASQVASVWFAHNRDGTLLALASLAPPIRAVGPLVAVFMIAIVAGAIFILPAVYNSDTALVLLSAIDIRLHFGVYGTIALVLLSGAILMGLMGWLWLRWLGRRYRAQRLSDQSIMIDAVLLIFGFEYSIGFAQKGPVWLLAPVAAILAYKIVATTELRLLRRYDPPDVDPKQLLLLRVFSLGRRSGRLFGGFSKLWRHVGTLRMIAGPDLATSTVEPHEFLDFLAGHLQRRFISGPAALEQRLAESKPRCDPDGRYRSSNFFCYDDTWKMVLGRLAEDSDAVLMDLRGFTKEARGCIYEIHELLDVVPLECIVFVIDRTSDEISLAHVFSDGWARLCAASPNRADLTPRVRLVRIDGLYGRKIGSLVALLAATTDPRGRQVVLESSHPAGPVAATQRPGSAPV